MSLTVVILTHNEEIHIRRAILSVADMANDVVVVDSGSTDQTVAIAEQLGARIFYHTFENHSRQFNWALDHVDIASDWIMRLDADEVVSPELAVELKAMCRDLQSEVVGILINRRHIFMNRWVRHGGRYPLTLLRVWRNGRGRVEDRWMDEHVVLQGGQTVVASHDFCDHNLKGISFFVEKHNSYATREAVDVILQRLVASSVDERSPELCSQAGRKRWLKLHLYNRTPYLFSSTLYFLWRLTVRAGILDGTTGLTYHFMQGWWYRMLVGAKVRELTGELENAGITDGALVRQQLRVYTGLDI